MPVPSKMQDLSTLAASNSPAGSDAIGNSLDDYLRATQAIVRSTNALASASIAAGSTVDLGTADAESVQVTGSATITSFGTSVSGLVREVRFAGVCTITNSSAIALPRAQNYVTTAGEVLQFRSLGSGNWVLTGVTKDTGSVQTTGGTITGAVNISPVASSPLLSMNKPTGAYQNQVVGTTAGVTRWVVALGDTSAEAGSNAGSNFTIIRYNDAGVGVDNPVSIARATGNVTLAGALAVGGTVTAATQFISSTGTAVITPTGAGQILLRPNGGGSSTGQAVIDSSGNVSVAGTMTAGSSVIAGTVLQSSGTTCVLASGGASGQLIIRPNGPGSSSNQAVLDTSGNLALAGAMTASGVTPGGGRPLNKITLSNVAPGTLAVGELYLQY